jgi:hypothetical protein
MNEKTYKQHLTIWIIVTVILVCGAYYAGTKHGKSNTLALQSQMRNSGGANGARRFGTGGGLISGDVVSKDDTSMTIKMRDGSSRIVLYSGTTQVLKSSSGLASDVVAGSTVSVQGTQNADGSVTAQSIQIRPAMPPTPKTN